MRRFILATVLAGFAAAWAADKLHSNSYQGKAPPEIVSGASHWSHTSPLTLGGLKGQVVYLEFGFLG